MSEFSPPALSPGEALQEVLAEHGMTRVDLASRLELSVEQVNALIAGESSITQEIALELAQLFNRSARFFHR